MTTEGHDKEHVIRAKECKECHLKERSCNGVNSLGKEFFGLVMNISLRLKLA
jgi:hypothetical protein